MTGPITVTECFSGTGPQEDLKGGVTIALDPAAWQDFKTRLPEGHAARKQCDGVDFSRSALAFIRFPSDSNTRLQVVSAAASPRALTLRLSRSQAVPNLLAVVPAEAWLIVEVPQASLKPRPQVSVQIEGVGFEGKVEFLGRAK